MYRKKYILHEWNVDVEHVLVYLVRYFWLITFILSSLFSSVGTRTLGISVLVIKTSSRLFILSNDPDKCFCDFNANPLYGNVTRRLFPSPSLSNFYSLHPLPMCWTSLPFMPIRRLPFPRMKTRSNNVNRLVVFLLGWL